jgi:hypothetical protein
MNTTVASRPAADSVRPFPSKPSVGALLDVALLSAASILAHEVAPHLTPQI